MRVFHSLADLPANAQGAVVALGNFDGVHPGHQAVLAETLRIAKERGAPSAVLTFTPHPREFFNPAGGTLSIYPLHDKIALLKEAGINLLYLAKFDAAFSQLSAVDFVEKILAAELQVCHVVTGSNFVFGCKRQGNVEFLRKKAIDSGFETSQVAGVNDANGAPISSSRIRDALSKGDVRAASALLGREYTICGHVLYGDGRGKQLGFPTANISVAHLFQPKAGVYAVRTRVQGSAWFAGVVNLGTRPTVGGTEPLLEAHCFGFNGDLYGKFMEIQLVEFIRAEQKFTGLDALKSQIGHDCIKAKEILGFGA